MTATPFQSIFLLTTLINHVLCFQQNIKIVQFYENSYFEKWKAFKPQTASLSRLNTRTHTTTSLLSKGSILNAIFPTQAPNTKIPISFQPVNTQPGKTDMMDVASLRNNCTSPLQMIEKQEAKKEAINSVGPLQSLLKGFRIGLLTGTGLSGVTYLNGSPILESLQTFVIVTIVVGIMISLNNLSGKNVYVYTEAEAINRLTVDFVSMLKSGDDLGFIAKIKTNTAQNENIDMDRYSGTNGVVACVDCQLRNSALLESSMPPSYAAKKRFGKLPSHFHMKNMLVDTGMRRQGVAGSLIAFVEDFARKNTDAELLTLEVDSSNNAALKLYESAGFVEDDEMGSTSDYGGGFVMGRKFMSKPL